MKLSEKGRFAPPPSLAAPAQSVSETVASWDDVIARAHWLLGDEQEIDGADFYVGEKELGHLHLDSEAHVFHSVRVASALIAAGHGKPFQWSRNVVVFPVASRADVKHALWLFRLSYDRRKGTPEEEILAQIDARA